MRVAAVALVFAALAGPAHAAATAWQELAPDARVRLIASEQPVAGGKTFIAIELDMPETMKTYWRVPGETGIAAELDLAGSSGVTGQLFHWPYPRIEQQGGITDFVYYGPLVLPLELTVEGTRPRLEASLLLGICSDICVPAAATFSLDLDLGTPDAGNRLRIEQALALAPLPWTEPTAPIGELRYDKASEALEVTVDPALADPASVLVDASAAGLLFGAPQKSREDGLVSLPLLGGGTPEELGDRPVTVVFMTPDGAYELERRVAASTRAGQ